MHKIIDQVSEYYTKKVLVHGSSFKGVDWNSKESQELRFEQLLQVCDKSGSFSINDYGCGYGYLFGYMKNKGLDFDYLGFDISSEMIKNAIEIYGNEKNCNFQVSNIATRIADYTVASGIFNVKLDTPVNLWEEYILNSLNVMDTISNKGFSFNCLTKYSDKERMREDLYYADPCWLFDYCKKHFSRNVALLHDYGLYEFTVIVRK